MINGPNYKAFDSIFDNIASTLENNSNTLDSQNSAILRHVQQAQQQGTDQDQSRLRRSARHRTLKATWDPSTLPLKAIKGNKHNGPDDTSLVTSPIANRSSGEDLGAEEQDPLQATFVSCCICEVPVRSDDLALECTDCLS